MTNKKRTLEFINGLEVLTLDELGITQREEDVGATAKPRLRHHDLILELTKRMEERGMKYKVSDIYVRQGGPSTAPNANVYPFLEEKYGAKALEAHVIRKLTVKILIEDLKDETTQSVIGVAPGLSAMVGVVCCMSCLVPSLSITTTLDKYKPFFTPCQIAFRIQPHVQSAS